MREKSQPEGGLFSLGIYAEEAAFMSRRIRVRSGFQPGVSP
jgi:hypothetical protein